jgi:lambda repressor-like predicted transcriptional regulator
MTLDKRRFNREAEAELKKRGLKKTDLAVMCGCSTRSIENTLYSPVDRATPTVKKIAEKLDLDISYLPVVKRGGYMASKKNTNVQADKPVITDKPRGDGSVIRTTETAAREKIEILYPEDLEAEKKAKEIPMIDDRDEFLKMNDEKIRVNSNKLEKELERQKLLNANQSQMIAELRKEKEELLSKTKYVEDIKKDLDKTYQEKEQLLQRLNELESMKEEQERCPDFLNHVMNLSIGSALKLKETLDGILK